LDIALNDIDAAGKALRHDLLEQRCRIVTAFLPAPLQVRREGSQQSWAFQPWRLFTKTACRHPFADGIARQTQATRDFAQAQSLLP
jgi:hypothetical protein